MKSKNKNKYIKIIGILIICGLLYNYIFFYDVSDDGFIEAIKNQIHKKSESYDAKIDTLDQFRSKYGAVILYKTRVKEIPAGYAIFKKDFLFNQYHLDEIHFYESIDDYKNDSDVLLDYDKNYIFKFDANSILIVNIEDQNYIRNIADQFKGDFALVIALILLIYLEKKNRKKMNGD